MMAYTVYVHVNKKNGKKYVGITKRKPKQRWDNGNGYYSNKPFYNAIRKYGWDEGFDHIIIETGLTAEDAAAMEKALIALYKSNNLEYGYNLTDGGFGYNGFSKSKFNYKWVEFEQIKKSTYKMALFSRLISVLKGGTELRKVTERFEDGLMVSRETKTIKTDPDIEGIKSFIAFYQKEQELQVIIKELKEVCKIG